MISAGGLFAGLALLTAAVFLLQRLRVRRRELVVPTTIFWLEAQKESQARRLTERFRAPWVFLLLLGIVTLLWLAFAGPRRESERGRSTLVLVDTSAAMARTGRLDVALARATELMRGLPRERRALIASGARRLTLLAPGEPVELLAERLTWLGPAAGPADSMADSLAVLLDARLAAGPDPTLEPDATLSGRAWQPGSELTLIAIGAPTSLDGLVALAARDPKLELELVPIAPGVAPNEGILAMGAAPAASGAAARADLWIETTGPTPLVTLSSPGGSLTDLALEVRAQEGASADFVARDVPLTGGTLTATMPGSDALALDDRASLVWPERGPVLVALDADLEPAWRRALEAVLDADTGLLQSDSGTADVRITSSAAEVGLPAPALVLARDSVTESDLEANLVGTITAYSAPGAPRFGELFDALALGLVGTGLRPANQPLGSTETPRPPSLLALDERVGSGPARLVLPEQLIAPPYELAEEREFPLLIGLGLRWLAARGAQGVDLRRITSGDLVGRSVSLEPPSSTAPAQATNLELAPPAQRAELWPLLALLAAALLGFEWYLFGTRRIP